MLASNVGCHGTLLPRFLPTAVEILDSNEGQLPLGLVSVRVNGGTGRERERWKKG